MTCFVCGGPFHPATGWHFADGVDYCGPCARVFAAYYKQRMAPRKSCKVTTDFYGEAVASIGTSVGPCPAE